MGSLITEFNARGESGRGHSKRVKTSPDSRAANAPANDSPPRPMPQLDLEGTAASAEADKVAGPPAAVTASPKPATHSTLHPADSGGVTVEVVSSSDECVGIVDDGSSSDEWVEIVADGRPPGAVQEDRPPKEAPRLCRFPAMCNCGGGTGRCKKRRIWACDICKGEKSPPFHFTMTFAEAEACEERHQREAKEAAVDPPSVAASPSGDHRGAVKSGAPEAALESCARDGEASGNTDESLPGVEGAPLPASSTTVLSSGRPSPSTDKQATPAHAHGGAPSTLMCLKHGAIASAVAAVTPPLAEPEAVVKLDEAAPSPVDAHGTEAAAAPSAHPSESPPNGATDMELDTSVEEENDPDTLVISPITQRSAEEAGAALPPLPRPQSVGRVRKIAIVPKPKRPASAWNHFSSKVLAELMREHPDWTREEALKKVGAMWSRIKYNPEKVAPYEALVAADTKRFDEEMANYLVCRACQRPLPSKEEVFPCDLCSLPHCWDCAGEKRGTGLKIWAKRSTNHRAKNPEWFCPVCTIINGMFDYTPPTRVASVPQPAPALSTSGAVGVSH